MLATGLRAHGWKVVVLIDSRRNHVARRYFAAYGFHDFIYFDEIESSEGETEEKRALFQSLEADFSFAALRKLVFRGCWIGPQILASASRAFHQGSPNLEDPAVREWIFRRLPRVLQAADKADRVIGQLNPRLVFLNEANYSVNGSIVDCAIQRGVRVVQMIQPSKDDALYFWRLTPATRRSHPASVSPQAFARIQELPWTPAKESRLDREFADRYGGASYLTARNQIGVEEKSREDLVRELKLDPTRKIVVVFSHILWDANLFYGEDLFADYGDWFIQTIQAAIENPHVNWVIKLHPANVWKRAIEGRTDELAETTLIRERIGDLPGHIHLLPPSVKISTLSLFKAIDYGVTVRGTSGLELPCFGAPTLTAGTGRYSGLGFTNDSSSRAEYLGKLAAIHELPPMTAEATLMAKRHAWAAFFLRSWTMKSFRAEFARDGAGIASMDHGLRLTARSVEEIEANGDLAQWAEWCENGETPDYIAWERAEA
jgi:hypothetical protein